MAETENLNLINLELQDTYQQVIVKLNDALQKIDLHNHGEGSNLVNSSSIQVNSDINLRDRALISGQLIQLNNLSSFLSDPNFTAPNNSLYIRDRQVIYKDDQGVTSVIASHDGQTGIVFDDSAILRMITALTRRVESLESRINILAFPDQLISVVADRSSETVVADKIIFDLSDNSLRRGVNTNSAVGAAAFVFTHYAAAGNVQFEIAFTDASGSREVFGQNHIAVGFGRIVDRSDAVVTVNRFLVEADALYSSIQYNGTSYDFIHTDVSDYVYTDEIPLGDRPTIGSTANVTLTLQNGTVVYPDNPIGDAVLGWSSNLLSGSGGGGGSGIEITSGATLPDSPVNGTFFQLTSVQDIGNTRYHSGLYYFDSTWSSITGRIEDRTPVTPPTTYTLTYGEFQTGDSSLSNTETLSFRNNQQRSVTFRNVEANDRIGFSLPSGVEIKRITEPLFNINILSVFTRNGQVWFSAPLNAAAELSYNVTIGLE